MKREVGSLKFPIWLIGDSNPKNWDTVLDVPFDSRHPARHNIWTPIIDLIQDRVYREGRLRIETRDLYIRNAIESSSAKPRGNQSGWSEAVQAEVNTLSVLITQYQPIIVFTFGSFSYEFTRRSQGTTVQHPYRYWGSQRLGGDFRQHIKEFAIDQVNILPLLHTSISRGRFMESHHYFCNAEHGNYFEFTGKKLAQILLENRDELPESIWV